MNDIEVLEREHTEAAEDGQRKKEGKERLGETSAQEEDRQIMEALEELAEGGPDEGEEEEDPDGGHTSEEDGMGITPADYNHLNGRFDESHGKKDNKKNSQKGKRTKGQNSQEEEEKDPRGIKEGFKEGDMLEGYGDEYGDEIDAL